MTCKIHTNPVTHCSACMGIKRQVSITLAELSKRVDDVLFMIDTTYCDLSKRIDALEAKQGVFTKDEVMRLLKKPTLEDFAQAAPPPKTEPKTEIELPDYCG